tara:strand:+ start:660 stop:1376 length:717 start_codon:yes stop_codon:yes gene_type:complete
LKLLKENLLSEARNLSEQVYDFIRRDILQGILLPDKKLQIETVSERYNIGAVPVREALNRLSAEGLVERKKQRGFFVASLPMKDLEELVKTRIWLETKALSESIANGSEEWEDGLVLSFHRLARTSRRLEPDSGAALSEEWEIRHKEFHMQLINQCGSSWLLGFCSTMMDQAVRYRNISMHVGPSQKRREGAAEEHKEILDAVVARESALACKLLEAHYQTTLAALRTVDIELQPAVG